MDQPSSVRATAAFYEALGAEEDRLVATALGQLEFARSQELLQRHLPAAPARILDVGGGPGRYASWLAALGYTVHLVEPTSLHITQARRRSTEAGAAFDVTHGHAGALPVGDATQDVVLLFGPLYHLKAAAERRQVIAETRRVLVRGGLMVAVGITPFAWLLDGLRQPEISTPTPPAVDGTAGFVGVGHFHDVAALEREAGAGGFDVIEVLAVEGPGCLLGDLDVRWEDPDQRAAIVAAAQLVEREPSLAGASHHLMLFGRSRR